MGRWIGGFLYIIVSKLLALSKRCDLLKVELLIRLPLLNFRALGLPAEVVYIQQWVKKREEDIE